MLEKELERKLRKGIAIRGGKCRKWVSPGWKGAPDRIVLLPGGRIFFIEMKKPGEEPTPLQYQRLKELNDMGFVAFYLNSEEKVNNFLLML
jgi:hypothetical protein